MLFFRKKLSALLVAVLVALSFSAFPSCKKPTEKRDECVLSLEYLDGKIHGKAFYTLTNKSNGAYTDVKFNLYANAYEKSAKYSPVEEKKKADAFKGGYGNIRIEYAKANGKDAAFTVGGEDENALAVICDEYFPDERVSVELGFVTTLPTADLRLGKTATTINLADFYPVPCKFTENGREECLYSPFGDPYRSDATDFSVSLTLPSEYTVASSGYPEKTLADGEKTTYCYSLKGGRYFSFVLSKDFGVESRRDGDVTVTAFSAKGNQVALAETAAAALNYFSKTFGDYPYKSLNVADAPFSCGGMEYSGLCLISDALTETERKYAVVHEVAHQWWCCGVGNDQINAAYLDEGLAEFSTYLYLYDNGEKDEAQAMLDNAKSAYKAYFDIYKTLGGEANTKMQRNLKEFSSLGEYVAIAYDKSLLMFASYAETVGMPKTKKRLKKLYADRLYGEITLNDVTKTLGLKEHFVSYVDGKVLI